MPGCAAARRSADARFAGDFRLDVTGYGGHEEEILHVRNANRGVAQRRDYLDWRYRTLPGLPQPRVAWLRDADGQALGMAAAIYRRFWIDGAACAVGVLGDISLDARLRGQGLGQRLLAGLSRELGQGARGLCGFVIPTEAARRSLAALGWRDAGRLIPHVCPVDPAVRLGRRPGSAHFAALLAVPFRAALSLAARLQRRGDCSLELGEDFDARFDALWAAVPKAGRILSDRSRAALCWRYGDHPSRRFRIARFLRAGELKGYVVFETADDGSDLSIQDAVIAEPAALPDMLALFVAWCLGQPRLGTVRMSLSEGHPHAAGLWRLGFVPRKAQGRFQVLESSPARSPGRNVWCLTAGDKDI